MKTRAAVLALAVLVAVPSAAVAKTYTLTGKFRSDAGTISLKVKTNKKGKPVSVSEHQGQERALPLSRARPRGHAEPRVPGGLHSARHARA